MSTIYLTSLTQTRTLTQQGESTGALSPMPVTNASTINGFVYSLEDVQKAFLFYTTADGDLNLPLNSSDAFHANFDVLAKVAEYAGVETPIFQTAAEQSGAWVPNTVGNDTDLRTAYHEMTQKLAAAVFGSPETVDLFNNTNALMLDVAHVIWDCVRAININATKPVVREMFNFLLRKHPERFQLKYNAVVTAPAYAASKFLGLTAIGANGAQALVHVSLSDANVVSEIIVASNVSGTFTAGEAVEITDSYGGSNVNILLALTAELAADLTSGETGAFTTAIAAIGGVDAWDFTSVVAPIGMYTGLVALGVSTAESVVSVVYDNAGAITSMFVTTTTAAAKAASGAAEFALNESVTIADGGGAGNDIVISSINPIATAMLNGTLNVPEGTAEADIIGTRAPLEIGDTIGTFIIINSHADQKDWNNNVVSAQYVAKYQYQVQDGTIVVPADPTAAP